MPKKSVILIKFLLGNGIQTLQFIGIILLAMYSPSLWSAFGFAVLWIYLFPPFCTRLIFLIFGRPEGKFLTDDKEFWIWYFVSQLQVIYLRFSFLEEVLRLIPLAYSNWLRLWGSDIGKNIYWAPKVTIMDRSYLKMGDVVIIGYGAGFTSHHLNSTAEGIELILASPRVGNNAVLGGLSGMTPGSTVCDGETLPSTMGLAPFYIWQNGRRHAPTKIDV